MSDLASFIHDDATAFALLHGVRLRPLVDAAALADLAGCSEEDAVAVLGRLADDGLVRCRAGVDGGPTRFILTDEGRAAHLRAMAERASSVDRAALAACYDRFLLLNHELLTVCTAWQVRDDRIPMALNDHTDAAYDASVLARLTALHAAAEPVLADLSDACGRLARYRAELAAAFDRVHAGDIDAFTNPALRSYHTVWFELHEDLLVTLGLERK